MKLGYLLRESLRGFSSAKISTFASVITITLALILISIYYTLSLNSSKFIKNIKDKVELEVFLLDRFPTSSLDSLKESIKRIGGVKQITYVSKDEAAKIFEQEFGKEMLEVFDNNPLPPSLRVSLYEEYKTVDRVQKISDQISKSYIVSDIVYPKESLNVIENNSSAVLSLNLIILIIVSIASIFLVSNTIRLVIYSKRKIILTLKLLGATRNFIRTPFIIEGLIQGLLGGLLAVLALYSLFIFYFSDKDISLDVINWYSFFYLIAIGAVLGITGSSFSVRKFLKESLHE